MVTVVLNKAVFLQRRGLTPLERFTAFKGRRCVQIKRITTQRARKHVTNLYCVILVDNYEYKNDCFQLIKMINFHNNRIKNK